MEYTKLGNANVTVSVVALGGWGLASDATWGRQEEADSAATIRAALDAGVNFFDTAEGYGDGESERILGRALAGRRDEAVIATKVRSRNQAPDDVRKACEGSLRRLQTDYIDLYQVHWPSRTVSIDDTIDTMYKLREEGKIRAVGGCNLGKRDFVHVADNWFLDSNQLPYSLLWRAIEYEIVELCRYKSVGILCYSPLAQGLLTGKFASADEVPEGRARTRLFSSTRPQARHDEDGCEAEAFEAIEAIRQICAELNQPMAKVAIAWLLRQPGVTSVIAGARRPGQIEQTAQATELQLSDSVFSRLCQATEKVKEMIGPNADMWQSQSRMR